jgi:type II secretory pathway pseudopilin PulG
MPNIINSYNKQDATFMNKTEIHYCPRRKQGFTLPEVILIVAVMAIMTTMAFPDIVSFFRRQTIEQERLVLRELQKALDAYANENLFLPDAINWHEELAPYTNLSPAGILKDSWNQDRVYTVASQIKVYREGTVEFFYASVLSGGENRETDTPEWADMNGYASYQAAGDDLLIKYTDHETKQKRYDETVLRMERIISALDRYAQAQYNNAVLANEVNYDTKIFYPPSNGDVIPTNGYGAAVVSDTNTIAGGTVISGDVDSMKGLMRLLGLPEDHCCNALSPTSSPEAFFYAANPQRVNASGSCIGGSSVPPFVPPKISLQELC